MSRSNTCARWSTSWPDSAISSRRVAEAVAWWGRDPAAIGIGEVIVAMEEDLSIVDCAALGLHLRSGVLAEECTRPCQCRVHGQPRPSDARRPARRRRHATPVQEHRYRGREPGSTTLAASPSSDAGPRSNKDKADGARGYRRERQCGDSAQIRCHATGHCDRNGAAVTDGEHSPDLRATPSERHSNGGNVLRERPDQRPPVRARASRSIWLA